MASIGIYYIGKSLWWCISTQNIYLLGMFYHSLSSKIRFLRARMRSMKQSPCIEAAKATFLRRGQLIQKGSFCFWNVSCICFMTSPSEFLPQLILRMHTIYLILWCIGVRIWITAPHQLCHGPLTRYVRFRVAHAPWMPGTFSPPQTSKETDS